MPHFYLNLNLRYAQLASFFRLYFYCSLDQDLKVNTDRKTGQFFAGFFHILKRRKTALQLNRTETLELVLKNADVILYTHGRAYIKILFMTIQ